MKRAIALIVTLALVFAWGGVAAAEGQNGTTLSASVTLYQSLVRTYEWTIHKSVDQSEWNIFQGDVVTPVYTVAVNKTGYHDVATLSGSVSVTNGGDVPTQGLAITVDLTSPPAQTVLASATVDVSGNPVLDPGEIGVYDYHITYTPVAGVTYKATANVTILNHSGHLGDAFGPSPSDSGVFPSAPTSIVNGTVDVTDTNGQSWQFSNTGSVSYGKTFTAAGEFGNTATITQTGQSSSASVTVNTYGLEVSKTASTSYTRRYDWSIDKTGDQTVLTLANNEMFPVNYTVTVNATHADYGYQASGSIRIHNPAPVGAVINSIDDVVTGGLHAKLLYPAAISFPYTLPAGKTLVLYYSVDLPDSTARVNTATATLQNRSWTSGGSTDIAGATTDFTGSADVTFGQPTELIDETAVVTDSLMGTLGTADARNTLPAFFRYTMNVGPYTQSGTYHVVNTAMVKGSDTGREWTDSYDVTIIIPQSGRTLTIGYWKNHAGFGPQRDMVSSLLPIWLGAPYGLKSVQVTNPATAVYYLSMTDGASNGIVKLYAQLLAAKLNIANGADDSAVKTVITAADTFLATRNAAAWDGLAKAQKNQVLGWMSTLDQYNNGIIGPGHADQ